MTFITKDLGQIQALLIGIVPPTNIAMLWYDTNLGVNLLKYYDIPSVAWIPITSQLPSSQAGVVAFAGGGQAGATVLTKLFTRIDGAANDGASVLLIKAVKSNLIVLINNSGYSIDVFPSGTDNYLGLGSGIQTPLSPGNMMRLFCFVTGEWTQA